MSYRVQYEVIKPGGHVEREDVSLPSIALSDVWTHLAKVGNVVHDTIVIIPYVCDATELTPIGEHTNPAGHAAI